MGWYLPLDSVLDCAAVLDGLERGVLIPAVLVGTDPGQPHAVVRGRFA